MPSTLRRAAVLSLAALAAACTLPQRAPRTPAEIEYRTPFADAPTRDGAGAPVQAAAEEARSFAPSLTAPAAGPARAEEIVVAAGESLFSLSETHMVSLRALIEANDLDPPFGLVEGQTLRLPPPNTYQVRDGDTLYSVSRRYRVHFRSLAALNGIDAPYEIAPGQAIVLPALARDWEAEAAPHQPGADADIRLAAEQAAPEDFGGAPFIWPLEGRVVAVFGPQDGGQRNDGLNIAASEGAPVRATAPGVVVYAGSELAGYGQLVLVQHEGGWVSAYAHNRALLAAENDAVAQGQVIAEAGSTGSVETTQLHFELRRDGRPVDPAGVLPSRAS